MATSHPVYLEDLAVGDIFRSAEHALDTEQIFDFARQFDPQPFHLDPQAARDSLFKGLAASGWHTAAITMKLLVASLPLSGGIIGAGVELQWPRPTRADDRLHVVSTIRQIVPSRSKPDRGIITVECHTLNQDGDICQQMVTQIVILRRPG
ncbi:Acyl dehydratase [Lampropedia hyalina DSM 16112]|jgi:acyl dehydratase|uniref:Acyl dehydratase n=1 Tax=Lampropedia hyalina DSM 16112 TaxID=1122156 RepID=A0A1M4T950_9BURK|nr:MaoC family dehydratase [Lampropedia hyalina]SHE41016.1 Acyl dehydratase [Lampropedia hyalina DSM 16112]